MKNSTEFFCMLGLSTPTRLIFFSLAQKTIVFLDLSRLQFNKARDVSSNSIPEPLCLDVRYLIQDLLVLFKIGRVQLWFLVD